LRPPIVRGRRSAFHARTHGLHCFLSASASIDELKLASRPVDSGRLDAELCQLLLSASDNRTGAVLCSPGFILELLPALGQQLDLML
jgi:hypothetical protein